MRQRTRSAGIALAVVLLSAASGIGGVAWANHNFGDVDDGSFFGPSINAGFEAGCFTGFDDGTFRPKSNPNRGQFAFWTHNCGARASTAGGSSLSFKDSHGVVGLTDLDVEVGGAGSQQVHLTTSLEASATNTLAATCSPVAGYCYVDVWLVGPNGVLPGTTHTFVKNSELPQFNTISFTTVIPVDAGITTFRLQARSTFFNQDNNVTVRNARVSAIVAPFLASPAAIPAAG